MNTDPDSLPAGSQLCTACGLCCNGVLHPYAVLFDAEAARAREIGLDVFSHEGWPAFRLPCTRLDGRRCTVYDQRPRVCAAFKCHLLHRLEDGEVELAAALVLVRRAGAALAVIKAGLAGEDNPSRVWEQIRQHGAVESGLLSARSAAFAGSVRTLAAILHEHLLPPAA